MSHNASLEKLLILAGLTSLVFVSSYVYGIYLNGNRTFPVQTFWLFAIALPLSLMLLWKMNVKIERQLALILVVSAVLSGLFFLRFYFYGQDLVHEVYVAEMTRELGRWAANRIGHQFMWVDDLHSPVVPATIPSEYYASLSVTILPSILSQTTGMPMLMVFKLLLPWVSTLIVLGIFLIVRTCFDQKLALLSSTILVLIRRPPSMLRQEAALLFFLLAIFCILNGRPGKQQSISAQQAISMFFVASVALAHYGMFYFAIFGILAFYFAGRIWETKIFRRNLTESSYRQLLSGRFVVFAAVVGITWLFFVAYPILSRNVGAAVGTIEGMLGFSPAEYGRFQGSVIISSLGIFNAVVQWLERGLAIAGFILIFRKARNVRQYAFILLAGAMLGLVFLWAVVPNISLSFDLDRVFKISLFGFCMFIAVSIIRVTRGLRRWGGVLSALLLVLILLEAIHMPILYSSQADLTRQDYILSFTSMIYSYEPSDFQFARLIEASTPLCSSFLSDEAGQNVVSLGDRVGLALRGTDEMDAIRIIGSGKTNYFMVLTYLPGYFEYARVDRGRLVLSAEQTDSVLYGSHMNTIFVGQRAKLFAYTNELGPFCTE